jgi:predicted negative regulator of RcsB-dependent stress response
MTKTKTPAPVASDELDVDSLMDTLRSRGREITIGAIVVAAAAGGVLLWRLSALQKNERAEHALYQASDALAAGNRPLGANDLQGLVDRYRDTAAGVEGAMLLAQIDFEDEKWDDGLKVLASIQQSAAIKNFGPAVDGLMGGALADQKKYDDAAKHYLAAAAASEFQAMKDSYSADAARAFAAGGKKDQARAIWAGIVARPESPMIGEAKVRLGELSAAPATKN